MREINHCNNCEYRKDCKTLKDFSGSEVDFCDGCKDENKCGIMDYCEAGYGIQCNNGYEPKWLDDDD